MANNTEVKFTTTVPVLDALRRIVQRDFQHDMEEHARVMKLPEAERSEPLRRHLRNEHERAMVERTLGFDGSKDEIGK